MPAIRRKSPPCLDGTEDCQARQALARWSARLYETGLITGADGNLSSRIDHHTFWITPGGRHKGSLGPADMLKMNIQGEVLAGDGQPSKEYLLHSAVYQNRPEVRTVVHAHPFHAVLNSMTGKRLYPCLMPESLIYLGYVPTIPFRIPTSPELAEEFRIHLGNGKAFILERHGAVTLGKDFEEAFIRMETLEWVSRILKELPDPRKCLMTAKEVHLAVHRFKLTDFECPLCDQGCGFHSRL